MRDDVSHLLLQMRGEWKYDGPIFDAHTHISSVEKNKEMLARNKEYGIAKQMGIVHDEDGFKHALEHLPEKFVFAKYLSLRDIATYNVDPVLDQISEMRTQGYKVAKTWFGPRWRDFYEEVPDDFSINHRELEPIFSTLEDKKIPLIIHIGDPDTYYRKQYADSDRYGLKEDHLSQLEDLITRHPSLMFHVPHLAAQPEIHRLPELSRWMDSYPNLVLDTASSRWMCRELSMDVEASREFVIRYQDRVLFGTDLFAGRGDVDYFSGRIKAQRILWETSERGTPLPFPDADTEDSGGTFINGLDLPVDVLRKLYWENAERIYG